MVTLTKTDEGCWVDCHLGIYIGEQVIHGAKEQGFNPGVPMPEDGWASHEHYTELWQEAEDYLNQFAPNGYWIGSNENGDFGMWESSAE